MDSKTSNVTIRRLTAHDIPLALPLLLDAARSRETWEPLLWPLHADAAARVQAGLERDLTVPERVAWFLAEQGGRCVGVVKSGRYPAPPVYAELLAGLTGDDFHAATTQALSPLLNAAETGV